VSVFLVLVLLLGCLLSEIGRRDVFWRFARDRERARVMVFCVAEMGAENK
jgi:hypothetical protein